MRRATGGKAGNFGYLLQGSRQGGDRERTGSRQGTDRERDELKGLSAGVDGAEEGELMSSNGGGDLELSSDSGQQHDVAVPFSAPCPLSRPAGPAD